MESPDNTHKTAIKRRKLSVPARMLNDRGLILKPALDYGCGYGTDAKLLDIEGYDQYHKNRTWLAWNYQTILCTYVLNTLSEPAKREEILQFINQRLDEQGTAYITVRNDKANLNGYTSSGTWQGLIALPLPILITNKQFTTYVMRKDSLEKEES
jgi:hypothetical protein